MDVGAGTAADFAGKDVKGAVVLGDGSLGVLWREAVRNRGAAGVISSQVANYIRPNAPEAMDEAHKDVLQWGSVPYDEKLKAFGFKASWRAATRLREALKKDPSTNVRVEIESSFYTGPARTLAAEITGRTRPAERIVIVAHVQEPGANDNASGSGTLLAMALALNDAIARGALPRPERTLTFLWVDEIRGSRQWITSRPDEAKGVRYMFSMDMTGEDTTKTGGTFLIEKQADPSAVWDRPSDPHSEWGGGGVKAETLKGSLLNDLHLTIAHWRSGHTKGWDRPDQPIRRRERSHRVRRYRRTVTSELALHRPLLPYQPGHARQSQRRRDGERRHHRGDVCLCTRVRRPQDAMATVALLENAARARLKLERDQGPAVVAAAKDKAAAEKVEAQVIAAWIKWYGEALDSVATLSTTPASPALLERIKLAKESVR